MILLLVSVFVKKESDDEKELSKRQPEEYQGPDGEGPTCQNVISIKFKEFQRAEQGELERGRN